MALHLQWCALADVGVFSRVWFCLVPRRRAIPQVADTGGTKMAQPREFRILGGLNFPRFSGHVCLGPLAY